MTQPETSMQKLETWSMVRGVAVVIVLTCAPLAAQDAAERLQAEPATAQPTQQPTGPLPWEAPPRVSEPILRPPAGAKEILERYGIGASQLQGFFSGQPLGPSEEDVLIKILYRFPRLGLDNIENWRRNDVTWDQVAAAPAEFQTDFFRLHGRVKRVEKIELLPELIALLEIPAYYRVTLAIEDSPYQALICTLRVPAAWKLDEPLDERAAADGMFLKLGDAMAEDPSLVFASGRVAWLPDRAEPANHVGAAQIELAKLGVDFGLFDDVRLSNGRGIGDPDREAFYQLLHALSQPAAKRLKGAGPEPMDVVPLLENPAEHHGDLFPVRGTARRIMRVPVRDVDIQRRFGIDHYYIIELFLPLGEKRLQMGKDPTGEKNPIYVNSFPATLNVRQLPPGLEVGENLSITVRADAVFFKVWSYRSSYTDKFEEAQLAPLFFAFEPQVVVRQQESNAVVSTLVIAALGLAVGIAVLSMFWFRRSDKAFAAARRKATTDDTPPPDFSKLNA
jgi:hypothetical protein